ncbi:MAG: hypothetical protein KC561_15460 [Myxococcales bacterium]|nr:hypothetical protein [Myxococcales bacterium]
MKESGSGQTEEPLPSGEARSSIGRGQVAIFREFTGLPGELVGVELVSELV